MNVLIASRPELPTGLLMLGTWPQVIGALPPANAIISDETISSGQLTSFDLLVTPTMACLPPLIGAWRAGTERDPLMALLNSYPMGVFTSLFNVTGQPAMSIPIHHDDATGLPVGVQIVAPPWREDLLLQVSHTLELAHPWRDRRPPVS